MRIPRTVRSAIQPLAAASLLVMCAAATADAQWTRHHPSRCQPQRFEELEDYGIGGAGATNMRDNHPITLICASPDTSDQPDSGVTRVRVYVWDSNTSEGFRVRACRTLRDTVGSVCSDPVSTTDAFTGEAVLTLTASHLAVWDPIDFGYLEVVIPRNPGNVWNYFKGWITEF